MKTMNVSVSLPVPCIVCMNNKEGKPLMFLGYDLGYTQIALSWNRNQIAEILGYSVRDLVDYFKVIDGERTVYILDKSYSEGK